MRRRRRRRRHFGLWFFIFIIVAIAATTLFLIFRGAKVSGPDDQNTNSVTKVIDTTPTASSTKTTSGTWTASGKAEDPDGEALKVQVYLKLQANGHYRRELMIQGDSVRTIVDSGTYSGNKSYKLKSHQAVIFTYASKKAQRHQNAKATTQYGSDYAAYPSYLKTVLNNRVSKTSYRYVDTKLTLSTTTHTVPTLDAAMNDQANTTSDVNASSTSTSDSNSDNADPGNDASSESDSSDSDSGSSKMTVEKAQAIVTQQYPSSDYTITAMGQTGSNFTFVVINQKTRDNQYVTVNGDGEIQ